MIKSHKEKRETEHEIRDELKCDLCGFTVIGGYEWPRDIYEILETEVSMTVGTSYPESHNSVETIFDICPTCFKEKLIPLMALQNAFPRTKESDY